MLLAKQRTLKPKTLMMMKFDIWSSLSGVSTPFIMSFETLLTVLEKLFSSILTLRLKWI